MPDEIEDQIEEAALNPKRVRGDEGEVEAQSLRDLIEADRYLAAKNAASGSACGIRFRKLIPPGNY
jgi:hypothetical protein